MERILVCGGREFGSLLLPAWEISEAERTKIVNKAEFEKQLCFRVLNAAKQKYDIECIIQGGAKGADRLGRVWAYENNIRCEEYRADWDRDKKAAGPIRNQRMLDEAKPTLVVAFPGGSGTRDMVTRARKAGVKVIEVSDVVTKRSR